MSSQDAAPSPADRREDDEFTDGPPAMGVAILLCVFIAGMMLGAYLEWLR